MGIREIRVGSSSSLQVMTAGPAILIVRHGDKLIAIRLKSASLVPDVNANLFSVTQLITEGCRLGFTLDEISFSSGCTKLLEDEWPMRLGLEDPCQSEWKQLRIRMP